MSFRFSKMSDEEACGQVVVVHLHPHHIEGCCMRGKGHAGECQPWAYAAEQADGVCLYCRRPLDGPHHPDCNHTKFPTP